MKIYIVILTFLLFPVNAKSQSISNEKDYTISIKNNSKKLFSNKRITSNNGTSLLWKKVKQGEELHFKINVRAKNIDIQNLRIIAEDLLTEGHMGSLSKSFFRFSEKENNLQSWEASKQST